MQERRISIQEIVDILKIEYIGKNIEIEGLNLCNRDSVYSNILSYITSPQFIKYLHNEKIKAVFLNSDLYKIVSKELPDIVCLIVEYPEEYFYRLHSYLYGKNIFYGDKNFNPIIGNSCDIHPTVQIENGVIIGNNVKIGQYSVIKTGSIIENNVIIGCGSIISGTGFQVLKDNLGNNFLVEHAGNCKVCENVYIGDNSIICNSLFEGHTLIGNNTKIDNFVHIAHNCNIGKNCVLTAGVILSGTTIIEDNVWLAPNSTICNKMVLGKGSSIGIGSVVIRKVGKGTKVFGNPAREIPNVF